MERNRLRPGTCTASIGAVPHSVGETNVIVGSAANVSRIVSARPVCSNGDIDCDQAISWCGLCPRCAGV
ncbi:MAG: hypothetical protein EBQ75_06395 [Actinobacteria bacterium]|nr:hypothetical protein [Actinomycetota bacterium]